jgi:hypothetical protein
MTSYEIMKLETGLELDALIAKDIMEWRQIDPPSDLWFADRNWRGLADDVYWIEETEVKHADINGYRRFQPSTDIKAAWEIVEKFAHTSNMQFSHFWISAYPDNHWNCSIGEVNKPLIDVQAYTAPLAICQAALLAVTEGK